MTGFRRFIGLLLAVAILAVPLLAVWKAEALTDWWKLRDYSAPAEVAYLAQVDTMTSEARHYFYLNHPQIVGSADQFRQDCPQSEQTIVLGCYHGGENGIAVYAVNDARLNGVQEVTAAHEMLHAAYERLDLDKKNKIDTMLNDYYQNDLHDQRIINTMNAYKQSEPNDVVNEMNSIFGTEIASLPAPLEDYYRDYFTDRSAVVSFAQNYEGEFTSRLNQINAYDDRLTALKKQISQEEADLSAQSMQIHSDREELDGLRSSGRGSEYNSRVPAFNAEVNSYNQSLAKLRSDIATYNNLVDLRNAIANELRSLDSALDTRLQTQTAQ